MKSVLVIVVTSLSQILYLVISSLEVNFIGNHKKFTEIDTRFQMRTYIPTDKR